MSDLIGWTQPTRVTDSESRRDGDVYYRAICSSILSSLVSPFTMLLVARSFKRQVFLKQVYSQPWYRMSGRPATRPSRSLRISAAGGGALTATLMLGLGYSLYADAPLPSKESVPIPLSKSLTSYIVYSLCSVPGLVDASPALLSFCTSIPGLRQLTEALVRATFFEQVRAFLTWVIEMLTLRYVVHSLLAVPPPTSAYHLYVGFVRRTKARCLRIAWKPMLRPELALWVSGRGPCIGVS